MTRKAEPCPSIRQIHARQKINAGVPDQFRITDRPGSSGCVVVEMPVCPSPALSLVVHELEQKRGHAHLARSDPFALGDAWRIDRVRNDIHVARRTARIFLGGILDRDAQGATVMLAGLGHQVGQGKALLHRLRRGHLASRLQVTTVISAAFVIPQSGQFGRAQARI